MSKSLDEIKVELATARSKQLAEEIDESENSFLIASEQLTFMEGWDAAVKHLTESAGEGFEETDALREANAKANSEAKNMDDLFIEGARWQHQQSAAKIEALEREVSKWKDEYFNLTKFANDNEAKAIKGED